MRIVVLPGDGIGPEITAATEGHNERVARSAERLASCDAIMLAHFSTARALAATRARVRSPILTSPESAVAKMRSLVAP